MKHSVIALLLTLMSAVSWSETWECKQLRDVLVGPPFYIDQEETDAAFSVEVGDFEIRVMPEDVARFACGPENCRQSLSAKDFLIRGENDAATFILSAVGGELGFRATYSITSKPSVGETMIQMGVCSSSKGSA